MMQQDLCGNVMVLQCGQSAPVANACLAGIIAEALNHEEQIEDILGSLNGIHGLVNEEIIDLAAESQQSIRSLKVSPGMVLGSSFNKAVRPQDIERAVQVLQAHNVRYVFFIGDRDALELATQIGEQAQACGYTLSTIAIPVVADNSLPTTDHCLGYGSLAKHYAITLREVAYDVESLPRQNQVLLVEVAGRSSAWSTAATTLARRRNQAEDAPHLVYLPELPFSPERFLGDVRQVLEKQGWCMAVVSEGLVDEDGNYLAPSIEGMGLSDMIASRLKAELGVPVETIRLGLHERSASTHISMTDSQEATLAGQAAVTAALEGKSARMLALMRAEADHYSCEIAFVPLSEITEGAKTFPSHWVNEDGVSLSFQFSKYANSLIQGEVESQYEHGVVKLARLDKRRIAKKAAAQLTA